MIVHISDPDDHDVYRVEWVDDSAPETDVVYTFKIRVRWSPAYGLEVEDIGEGPKAPQETIDAVRSLVVDYR